MKKVLVVGPRPRLDEFKQLELQNAEVSYLDQFYLDLEEFDLPLESIEKPDDEYFIDHLNVSEYQVVFDLALDENLGNLDLYVEQEDLVVIGSAVKVTLAELVDLSGYEIDFKLFGMNAIPTFINRSRLELSLFDDDSQEVLKQVMDELGLEYDVVDDRVGMVTPRIICMIINEACFVLQEGTAGIAEVDQAMKLGTNYPHGPFEWADKIGVYNVYEILEALKEESGEEKYKMAPLLKKYYRKDLNFLN